MSENDSKEDPVFRLIEAAKAADEAFHAVGRGKSFKELCREDIQRLAESEKPMIAAREVLHHAVPQTTAGTLAYAEYWLRNYGFGQSLLVALKREFAASSRIDPLRANHVEDSSLVNCSRSAAVIIH